MRERTATPISGTSSQLQALPVRSHTLMLPCWSPGHQAPVCQILLPTEALFVPNWSLGHPHPAQFHPQGNPLLTRVATAVAGARSLFLSPFILLASGEQPPLFLGKCCC